MFFFDDSSTDNFPTSEAKFPSSKSDPRAKGATGASAEVNCEGDQWAKGAIDPSFYCRPIAKAVTGPKEPPGPPPKSGEVLPYLNDGEYGLYIPK